MPVSESPAALVGANRAGGNDSDQRLNTTAALESASPVGHGRQPVSAVRRLTPAGAVRLCIASLAHAPLVEAMRAGVAILWIWPDQRFAPPLQEAISRPWIAIVGDDNEVSYGPCRYYREGLRRLAKLADGLAVYSGAASVEFYALFATTAALDANVLVIETQLAHHAEWSEFLRGAAPQAAHLDIMPRGGSA
jgi:hypothetical protein